MKRKIAICLFILGILTVLTFVGCADREEYALAKGEGGVIIKDYRGKGGVISGPSEIDGKKVVGIGEFAFANCQGITEVVIPDGVREIGAYAFVNSSKITRITLPKMGPGTKRKVAEVVSYIFMPVIPPRSRMASK